MKTIWKACLAAAGSVCGWAALENTVLLRTRRYQTDFAGLPRLVQISDLHRKQFGKGQKRLIRKVAALKPEYIVITGDLISRRMTDFSGTEQLLRALCNIAPVLIAEGNHEADLCPLEYAAFREAVRRSGAQYLKNETVTIGSIKVAALALPPSFYRGGGMLGFSGTETCTAKSLRMRLGICEPDTLLLAHNPLFFPAYAEWGAKLTLSGHVHGGAVRLPFLGGLLSPERKFFPRYDKGFFRIGDACMIVSGGLGKLRLFNPPELCLITGTPAKTDSDCS